MKITAEIMLFGQKNTKTCIMHPTWAPGPKKRKRIIKEMFQKFTN
jgi:hypothetical protein